MGVMWRHIFLDCGAEVLYAGIFCFPKKLLILAVETIVHIFTELSGIV